MKQLLAFLAAVLLILPASGLAQVDFGDHRSETLTSRAWDAYNSQRYEDALAYINKCIELYRDEAVSMQASLSTFPSNEPKEETAQYWALNDVGTCLFIKGEILLARGDTGGARAAYQDLVDNFLFAQCWDPKGWFWQPAQSARQKLVELEFDAE